MNQLVPISSLSSLPTFVAAAGERASMRFLEFFAAKIRNPHARRAWVGVRAVDRRRPAGARRNLDRGGHNQCGHFIAINPETS